MQRKVCIILWFCRYLREDFALSPLREFSRCFLFIHPFLPRETTYSFVHSTLRCVILLWTQIRDAQLAQFNYILVVGEIEEAHKTVNVRTRDNEVHGEKSLEDLLAQFKELEETLQ